MKWLFPTTTLNKQIFFQITISCNFNRISWVFFSAWMSKNHDGWNVCAPDYKKHRQFWWTPILRSHWAQKRVFERLLPMHVNACTCTCAFWASTFIWASTLNCYLKCVLQKSRFHQKQLWKSESVVPPTRLMERLIQLKTQRTTHLQMKIISVSLFLF